MELTNEEIAGGVQYDSQIEAAETLRRKKIYIVIKASLFASTALAAACLLRSYTKPPTVH